MHRLVNAALALCLLSAPALAQEANIHGQTGSRPRVVDTTDMSLGTLEFMDRFAPGPILLRLTLPRAYVVSHKPTDERGVQYVSLELVYPGLEPASVVRRRAFALHGTMPQAEYLVARDDMFYRRAFSINLNNDFQVRFRDEQRARLVACQVSEIAPRLEEVRPEPVDRGRRADCAELFRTLPSKTERVFAVDTNSGERFLLSCPPDVDTRRFSRSCELMFRFRGFDWKITLQPSRVREAPGLLQETIDLLSSFSQ